MRHLAYLPALIPALLLCLALVGCGRQSHGFIGEERFDVHDPDLLTAEQQHELVRDGYTTVKMRGGVYVTFKNDESMKPYLNEGGLEGGWD